MCVWHVHGWVGVHHIMYPWLKKMPLYTNTIIMTLHSDDHSRVVLSVPDADGSDYINASFIDVSVLYMYACLLRVVCIHVYTLHTSKQS